MTTTLDELVTPLTSAQVETALYDAMLARGLVTTSWKPGAVTRTLVKGVSIVLAALSALQAMIAKGGFLDLATGPWLTLLARYVYDVERDAGSFATGEITADNTGGGVYAGDPGDLVVLNSTTGKSYRNTAAFSIGSLQTGVVIPVQAVELGTDSNAVAGELDTLETTLLGVTVTNTAALVGTDEELDPALRTRCREKTGALSPNGPRDAYLYFAKSATRANGASIGVTRVRAVPDGYGGIDLYVATASGGVTGTVGDLDTDLGRVDDEMQRTCTPLGIDLRTQTATVETVAVTYEVWVAAALGRTEAQHEAAVSAALLAHFAAMPIGGVIKPGVDDGKVYVQAIRAEIARALGGVIDLSVTLPASDLTLLVSEAPVVGTITPTVHIVSEEPS